MGRDEGIENQRKAGEPFDLAHPQLVRFPIDAIASWDVRPPDTKLCSIGSQYSSLTYQDFSHFF
ncbi:MAG: hypothetical protein LBQ62_04075, partial [Candidatus Accumulibacter sp.]|nr:hypothetical protein [Accumulibacter sp.]